MNSSLIEKYAIVVLVNGFFISEAIRKFIIGSQLPLIIYETTCVVVALLILRRAINRRILELIVLCLIVIFWGIASSVTSKFALPVIFLGLRTYIFPLAALILGARLVQILGKESFERAGLKLVTFWITIITSIAILQMVLGPQHPLTVGVGREEAMGLGGWGTNTDLFRTTSIFQHTGKYGQVIFILCSYSLYLRRELRPNQLLAVCIICLELTAVFVSGQRTGLIFYIFIAAALYLSNIKSLVYISSLSGFAILTSTFLSPLAADIAARNLTTLSEIPTRITSNVILPVSDALASYPIGGIGFGSLSFGSLSFGGDLLTSYINAGNAESSYARIIVETGTFGLLLASLYFFHGLFISLSGSSKVQDTLLRRFAASLIISVLIWGNTHDTLGATATIGIMFFIISPIYVGSRTRNSSQVQNGILK